MVCPRTDTYGYYVMLRLRQIDMSFMCPSCNSNRLPCIPCIPLAATPCLSHRFDLWDRNGR